MKARLIVTLLTALLMLTIAAKKVNYGSISGTVKEKGKQAGLVKVEVMCVSNDKVIASSLTNTKGFYTLSKIMPGTYSITTKAAGFKAFTQTKVRVEANKNTNLNISLQRETPSPQVITDKKDSSSIKPVMAVSGESSLDSAGIRVAGCSSGEIYPYSPPSPYTRPNVMMPNVPPPSSTDDFSAIKPNIFHSPLAEPLSTFSIDVDTANYTAIRKMLNDGFLPEPNSVRIEELLNYFAYNYPQPKSGDPFAVYTEMSVCPWNQKRNLVHIGIQGKKLNLSAAPPSNLVFLIDVSGSMNSYNKLPLVQESLNLLVENMRGSDKVSIVVYAGAAGEVLPTTNGNQKIAIRDAISNLRAGGSTAGGAGIQLAYKIARENFIQGGNNRIILCTDGDFNVGASSDASLVELVEANRKNGVYITVLGYGMGNYKDNKLELLADKGNGNYAYIDTIQEAKKVLVNEMASTLYTIAKDVKLQIEFNPAQVKAYRLIGYENRLLNKEDFKDDTKDAGELGAGHNVTAVYEIIPMASKERIPELDELKYQEYKISEAASKSPEALTVKLRYKLPDSESSDSFEVPVMNNTINLDKASETYLFSAAVIGYGMLLQNSVFKEALTWDMVKDLAKNNLGKDSEGYRAEFLQLVDKAAKLAETREREANRDYNKGYE